jgi:hypothetical protein
MLDKEIYEASPYASVHKFSHDISPARAALGTNGCTDCHSFNSSFFFTQTLKYPFDENGKPVTEPQYKRLDISAFIAYTGAFRESIVKPVFYFGIAALIILLLVNILILNLVQQKIISSKQQNWFSWLVSFGVLAVGIFGYFAGDLGSYMFPTRTFLDANHFLFSLLVLLIGIWFYLKYQYMPDRKFSLGLFSSLILITILSGIFMLIKLEFIETISHLAYTVFDLSLIGILIICTLYLDKAFGQGKVV